jgi:very-short-patch-repair endonuclease
MRSQLEILFERHIQDAGLPEPETAFRFAKHIGRRWEADFAFPEHKLLVEIEGGEWARGRHTRGKGFIRDAEKYAEAQIMGWRVLRIPGTWVHNGEGIRYLERLLNALENTQ